jgi:hypothetical protein
MLISLTIELLKSVHLLFRNVTICNLTFLSYSCSYIIIISYLSGNGNSHGDPIRTMRQNRQSFTSNTPLMIETAREHRGPNPPNPIVINSRLSELSSSRATMWAILVVNSPQILAALIVLPMHGDDTEVCSEGKRNEWFIWSTISALRLFLHTSIVVFMHTCHNWLEERPRILQQTQKYRSLIDAFGLAWFVLGNMWLLGDDDDCVHPTKSPVYMLALIMLIISYVQICLPCIIAVAMIPVFCFCMPCLIRLLARLQHLQPTKGATEAIIDTIPLLNMTDTILAEMADVTCPVCLNDMEVGQEARKLPCEHYFHKGCVDEWLKVNASCPTCRYAIVEGLGATNFESESHTTQHTGGVNATAGQAAESTLGLDNITSLLSTDTGDSEALDQEQGSAPLAQSRGTGYIQIPFTDV